MVVAWQANMEQDFFKYPEIRLVLEPLVPAYKIAMEMSPFWHKFIRWLQWKLSFQQLPVQSERKYLKKYRYIHICVYDHKTHHITQLRCHLHLIHWGRVTHTCVSKLTIIWTNPGILFIRTLCTNFGEISSEVHTFSFTKLHLKMSSAKWWQFPPGLNVLRVF